MPIVDRLWYTLGLDTKGFNKNAKSADKQADKLGSSIKNKLTVAIKGAVGAYLGWKALGIAKDLAVIGAQAERLSKSFDSIATSYGLNSQKIMAELRSLSAETVSDIQLMTQASSAAIMGLSMQDLPKLMEIARAASIAFNKSTSFMFESIVLGIARQSRMILDNLGIIINQEEIYKAETERLGRALTDAEKKQIFFNEALKQGQNIIARVGTTAESSADKQEKLAASYENTKAAFGMLINKIVNSSGLLDTATKIIEGIAEAFDKLAGNAEDAKKSLEELYAMTRAETSDTEAAIKELDDKLLETILKQGKYWDRVKIALSDNNMSIEELREAWLDYRTDFSKVDDETYSAIENYMQLQTTIDKLKTKIIELRATFDQEVTAEVYEPIKELNESLKETITLFRQLSGNLEMGKIEGFGIPKPEMQEALTGWTRFWEHVKFIMSDAIEELGGIFQGFLDILYNFSYEMEEGGAKLRQNLNAIQSAIQGDWASFMLNAWRDVGFENFYANMMTEFEAMKREVDQHISEIVRETENVISSVDRLTTSEREEYLGKYRLALLTERNTELIEAYNNAINELNASLSDYTAIRGIDNFRDAVDYLLGQDDVTLAEGQRLIDYWANMFDLTAEQQIELYDILGELIENAGGWTTDAWMRWMEIMDRLQEERDEVIRPRPDVGTDIASQTYRSITTITESQANILVAVLNTIRAEVQSILDVLTGIAQSISGGLGGAVYNVGGITFNITGSNGNEIADSVVTELRGLGMRAG